MKCGIMNKDILIVSLFNFIIINNNKYYYKLLEKLNKRPYTSYSQISDPLYSLVSEVEQPEVLRKSLKEWRKGAEIRSKMPYYPDTKQAGDYFHLI